MNFNKFIFILPILVIMLSACSQESAESPVVSKESNSKTQSKTEDFMLKDYKDKIQQAKDMEKKVLERAEKSKKDIKEASGK